MSDIAARVIKTIVTQLAWDHPERVVPAANLADDLGEDSLDRVELVMALEEEFHIDIQDADGEKFTDVQSVIDYITSRQEEFA